MSTKEFFMDQFLNNFASAEEKILSERINGLEAYISENGYDAELQLILCTYRVFMADNVENDHKKSLDAAAPAFEILQDRNLGWFELRVLGGIIDHYSSYTKCYELMQEALDVLEDKFSDYRNYDYNRFRFYFCLTLRLIRARYHDVGDPADIKTKFDHCVKEAIALCQKHGWLTLRTVALTRQAIFYADSDKILECMAALKDTKDKEWIRTTNDEIVENFKNLKTNITPALKRYIIGVQIQKRRKELGLTTRQLADALDAGVGLINEYERGAKEPGVERLILLADILKVDFSYFYGSPNAEETNATTDIATHKMVHLMSNMSETEKEFVINIAKGYIKLKKTKAPLDK